MMKWNLLLKSWLPFAERQKWKWQSCFPCKCIHLPQTSQSEDWFTLYWRNLGDLSLLYSCKLRAYGLLTYLHVVHKLLIIKFYNQGVVHITWINLSCQSKWQEGCHLTTVRLKNQPWSTYLTTTKQLGAEDDEHKSQLTEKFYDLAAANINAKPTSSHISYD